MDNLQMIEDIEKRHNQIITKDLDISFNELSDMYLHDELNIRPDFQRLFRWSEEQQSRFIESMILGLPLPPIYLIENEDLSFDLIDGLQRISSYLHFTGNLKNYPELKLTGCDLIEELNGLTYENLPNQVRIRIKRTFVRAYIIKKGSDALLGYHMFKRLNNGGSILSPQEIRSVNIKLIDRTLIEYIEVLSSNSDLKNTLVLLSDDKKERQYEQELVIRYLAIKYDRENYTHQLNDYLNNFLEKVARRKIVIDREAEKITFEKTFNFFNRMEGEDSFRRYAVKSVYSGSFVVYIYEALTIGVGEFINDCDLDEIDKSAILKIIREIKNDTSFIEATQGAGINNLSKLNDRVEIVHSAFLDLCKK